MISVSRRLSQVISSTFTGRQQAQFDGQHEPISTKQNMVVSSRSSRGRSNLANEHESSPSSPTNNSVNSYHDPNASLTSTKIDQQHDDAGSSRAKRSRLTSVSDRESLQKRRRLSKGSTVVPPPVHIPLRSKHLQDSQLHKHVASRKSIATIAPPPPLVTHDSTVSNSPLNSPNYRPQYDQFKRIEEKAQRVIKKNPAHEDKRKLRSEHGSTRSKTELAQYFPNFDDLLSLEPIDPSKSA